MNLINTVIHRIRKHFFDNSLRRNSSYLILGQLVNAGTVFLFWIICARLFTTSNVGLATSIISFGGLIAAFTSLGLPNTVARFMASSKNKSGLLAGSLILVFMASIIGIFVAVILIGYISPKLSFIRDNNLLIGLFFLLILGNAISPITDGVLMSFRRGEYVLMRAITMSIPKLIFPFLAVGLALNGIIAIHVFTLCIGVTFSLYVITRKLLLGHSFNPQFKDIASHRSYVTSNYFGGMFGILPSTLVPLLVLNNLGAEQAAYFYIPMQMAMLLSIISSSTSQALISETSQLDNDNWESHRVHFISALKHLFALLIPAMVGLALLGWPLLRVYGANYANNSYILLLLLIVSSSFVAINWLGDSLLNMQKRTRAYFLMNGLNSILVLVAVYVGTLYGLIGVGIGWLIAQALSAVLFTLFFIRKQILAHNFQ